MKSIYKYSLGAPADLPNLSPTVKALPCCGNEAQKVMVGTVIDADTQQVLYEAVVRNLTQKTYGLLGSNGKYQLAADPEDDIQITYVGYKTFKAKAKDVPQVLVLKYTSEELEGVTVCGNCQKNERKKTEVVKSTDFNSKLKKYKKWIWLLIAAGVIGGGAYYYYNNQNKKLKK